MRTWLSRYLSTLIMIPVVLLILVGIFDTYRALMDVRDANYTQKSGLLIEKTANLVHEMQKERGMSAGFISSNGVNFATDLTRQRSNVDDRINLLNEFIASAEFDEETSAQLDTLLNRFRQLKSIRGQVSNQSIAVGEMLSYYTENNRLMIQLNTVIAHHVASRRASQQFETLYNVASIKENAGIERAVLSSAFGRGSFTPELYKRFLTLLIKQQTYLESGELLADKEYLKTLIEFKTSSQELKVNEYRLAAENENQLTSTSAVEWFDAATQRIDLLKKDEEILLSQIQGYADDQYSSSITFITVEFILLLVTLFLTYVILRTLKIRAVQTSEIDRITTNIVNNRDLSTPVEVTDGGELGMIATDINNTLQSLNDDFTSFQRSASEVVDASQNTSVVVEQTSANIHAMRENIKHLMETFNTLNTQIMGDIAKIGDAEEMTSQVASGAQEGASSVSSAVDQISDMASEVDSVGAAMKHLNERVNDILGMVDVIRSVAEQTNLLALNAAIEAARAGEQGRGFAVVADEVRTLASRTQDSTEEIARVVDELMSSTKTAITAIEVGNDKAKGAVDAVNSIDEVLNSVVGNITNLDSLTKEISGSAKNQMQQITLLSAKVLDIDHMADENAKGGEEVASATIQVFNMSAQMMSKINTYKTTDSSESSTFAAPEPTPSASPVAPKTPAPAPKTEAPKPVSKPAKKEPPIDEDDNIEFF